MVCTKTFLYSLVSCRYFYCAMQICIARTCYGNVAGWLSVTHRYCIKMAKPILKLFRPSGSPIILVSSDPGADTQFQGEPFSGGVKYMGSSGMGKIAIFVRVSTDIAVYLGIGAR